MTLYTLNLDERIPRGETLIASFWSVGLDVALSPVLYLDTLPTIREVLRELQETADEMKKQKQCAFTLVATLQGAGSGRTYFKGTLAELGEVLKLGRWEP